VKRKAGEKTNRPLYLVTGGAGFIGSHLSETLVNSGQRVRIFDDFSAGKRSNLAGFADKIEIIEGDVRDFEACLRACQGADYVLHHAARVSVPESIGNPVLYEEVNALGTLKMLQAAQQAGCKRFVYPGSASAYGNTTELPHCEDMIPQPLSPYAITKHVGELYARVFFELHGLETVVLRYFNVFGPRQDPRSPYSGVIALFMDRLLRSEDITILGDGVQSRDFVAVENIVAANLLACTAPDAPGQIINIGCGEQLAINDLAEMLIELIGAEVSITHAPARAGDVRHSVAAISRAQALLGYRVGLPVWEGLRRTIAWYREQAASGKG
jgi:nucleoside-diphosphate-sugar epimerase